MELKKVIQYFLAGCNENAITEEHITLSYRIIAFIRIIDGGGKPKLHRAKEIAIAGEINKEDAEYVKVMKLLYNSCCVDKDHKRPENNSKYYGSIGEYVTKTVEYDKTITGTSQHGIYHLVKFKQGLYTFSWFAPFDVSVKWGLDCGDSVTIEFSVSKHEDRFGTLETNIKNVRLN